MNNWTLLGLEHPALCAHLFIRLWRPHLDTGGWAQATEDAATQIWPQ